MIDVKVQAVEFDDGEKTLLETWGTSGPDILCVHGITGSRRAWVRFAERFSDHYRVHAYDQRGHGDSAGVHGPMTLDRSVRDLELVADAIGRPLFALVGHSWGGAVVLLAGRETEVARVVSIDPFVHADANFSAEYVEDLKPLFALDDEPLERTIRETYAAWHPVDVEGKLHAVRRMSVEPIARLGIENGVAEGRWNLLPQMASYPKPLLLLIAGQQSIISDDDQAWIETNVGPLTEIVRFPNDGHNLHRTNFEGFAASVNDFFEQKTEA